MTDAVDVVKRTDAGTNFWYPHDVGV